MGDGEGRARAVAYFRFFGGSSGILPPPSAKVLEAQKSILFRIKITCRIYPSRDPNLDS